MAKPHEIRSITFEGDVAIVQLTQGFSAIIDSIDADLIAGRSWHVLNQPRCKTQYAVARGSNLGERLFHLRMHVVVMPPPDGFIVDHINGDGLDNRRCNLRIATRSQNQHNQGIRINNKSGYKGVHWDSTHQTWKSEILLNRKKMHLGSFKTPEAAHEAYKVAAATLHGDFARFE